MTIYHHEQSPEEKARSKRGKRSRRKGHDFERRVVREIRAAGIRAKRGLQSQSGHGCADVQIPGDYYCIYHCELKAGARPNIHAAIEQAIQDSRGETVPVAITHKDSERDLVTMELDDWLNLLNESTRRDQYRLDDGENES